jgi:hypothetical protein
MSGFASSVGEPNNGVIKYCGVVTADVDDDQTPTTITKQLCNVPSLGFCAKQLSGIISYIFIYYFRMALIKKLESLSEANVFE